MTNPWTSRTSNSPFDVHHGHHLLGLLGIPVEPPLVPRGVIQMTPEAHVALRGLIVRQLPHHLGVLEGVEDVGPGAHGCSKRCGSGLRGRASSIWELTNVVMSENFSKYEVPQILPSGDSTSFSLRNMSPRRTGLKNRMRWRR